MWQIDFYLALQRERERQLALERRRQFIDDDGVPGGSSGTGRLSRGIRAAGRVAGAAAGAIAEAIERPIVGSNHV